MAEERKCYKPGDTFTHQMLEFAAHHYNGHKGCEPCVGNLHFNVCDILPSGCGRDEVVWKARNESAKVLHVLIKLEGTI